MSDTQKQILYSMALKTDLQRLGYIETTNLTFLMNYSKQYTDYIENMMRLGVAQSMLQGIGGGMTETSLIIRDLSPMEDLLTGLVNGPVERLHSNAWIQDYTKTLATCRSELGGDEKVMGRFDIYETNKWVKNDQKVIVIYGLEFLNPVKRTLATEIMFWRGHVKLESRYPIPHKFATHVPEFKDMTIVDYDNRNDGKKATIVESKGIKYASNMFYHNPVIFFDTPIIYGKDSLMRITSQVPMNRLSTTEHENIDEIKILGFTIEPIGLTCMG